MDSSSSTQFDIFQIYRRYCDIRLGNARGSREEGYMQDHDSCNANFARESLAELLKFVHLCLHPRISVFDELSRLMSRLELMVDFSEFSRFYDFVFFMCRENGQKNITVSKAVIAWRLVLPGRFRLLNEWCDFVEKNQRYNISEDTWRQVLTFSRCVHETLEGYDPEGAWPVLIDDFVEQMYRVSVSIGNCRCNCGDLESQPCSLDDSLPGLKISTGLKRKFTEELREDNMNDSDTSRQGSYGFHPLDTFKRSRLVAHRYVHPEGNAPDDCMEIRNNSPLNSSTSPCAVEDCLSKGFAGLYSKPSYLQFESESTGRRYSCT